MKEGELVNYYRQLKSCEKEGITYQKRPKSVCFSNFEILLGLGMVLFFEFGEKYISNNDVVLSRILI